MRRLFLVTLIPLLALGCSSSSNGTGDAGSALDAGNFDAGNLDGGNHFDGGCPLALTWGNSGGMAAYTETSQLLDCTAFTLTRTPQGVPDSGGSCQAQLDAVTTTQLEAALANTDVVAAIDAAPVLYGIDPRPVDGTVFELVADGSRVDVGTACGGQSGCVDAPAGVTALVNQLQAITAQVRANEPSCAPLR